MAFDWTKLTGSDGNPIDTSKIDPAILATMGAAFESFITANQEQTSRLVEEGLKTGIETALAPITEQLTKLSEAGPAPKPKADPKNGPTPEDNPALTAILEKLGSLETSLAQVTSEREAEQKQRTATQVADKFIADRFPNLKGKDLLRARLIDAGVGSEDDAKKLADGVLEEWKNAGADVDAQMSADPKGEGGSSGGGDEAEQEKQDKLDRINNRQPAIVAG